MRMQKNCRQRPLSGKILRTGGAAGLDGVPRQLDADPCAKAGPALDPDMVGRAGKQEHPVYLGPKRFVVLRQKGFFDPLGIKIGQVIRALAAQLAELVNLLLPRKGALLGTAVGLFVGLGQHLRFGTQIADAHRQGDAQLVVDRLLQLPQGRSDLLE